jgi:hypothetical protein
MARVLAESELVSDHLEYAWARAEKIYMRYEADNIVRSALPEAPSTESDAGMPHEFGRGQSIPAEHFWETFAPGMGKAALQLRIYRGFVSDLFQIAAISPFLRLLANLQADIILQIAVLVDVLAALAGLAAVIFGAPAFAQTAPAADASKSVHQLIALVCILVLCFGLLGVLGFSPHKGARKIAGDLLKILAGAIAGGVGKSLI